MLIWQLVFSVLVAQEQFRVEVSPDVFRVTVEQPVESPAKPVETPIVIKEEKPFYVVMFTASWCGPCQSWKNGGGPGKIRAAKYNFTPIDIDANPKWKSQVDRYPTFWIVDHATRNPQYKFIGPTPPETIILKAEQLAKPQDRKSLFGLTGTSHESRETLIEHLLQDGIHKGRHSRSRLQSMTDDQLNELHQQDHSN